VEPDTEIDQHPADASVRPAVENKAGRRRLLVGALAVAAAVLVGGILSTNNGPTQLDVTDAANEDVAAEEATPEEVDADSTEGQAEPGEEETEAVFDNGASPVGSSFVPLRVVYADGEFVSIGSGPSGTTVSRSVDGTDWSTTTVEGIPDNANAYMLTQADSGWVMIVEIDPAFDEADEVDRVSDGRDVERWLARSSDLVNWTITKFPDLKLDESESAWVNGMAVVGDRVGIVMDVLPTQPPEIAILVDAGVIPESGLQDYCGFGVDEGGPIVGYTCGFGDGQGPEEMLFRLDPGDPVYDEIEALYANPEDHVQPSTILSGPLDGPFDVSMLPARAHPSSIVAVKDGFVVAVSGRRSATVLTSPDGITWTPAGELDEVNSFDSVVASGGRLLASSFSGPKTGSIEVRSSSDSGATWTSSPIETELIEAYGTAVAGPAGFAILIEGSQWSDIGWDISKDGFTMALDITTGLVTLTGPGGEIIHDSVSLVDAFTGGIDSVVRTEGAFSGALVWLDPETGDDLVLIDESDMEAAEEEHLERMSSFESAFEEQSWAGEIWFSADGLTWTFVETTETNKDNGHLEVSAVGDDEILVRITPLREAPAELWAFEREDRAPNEEEMEALDSFFSVEERFSTTWRSIPVG